MLAPIRSLVSTPRPKLVLAGILFIILTVVAAVSAQTTVPPVATASIGGRVTMNGQPVSDIFITVREVVRESVFGRTVAKGGTGADGRFQFTNLPAGRYLVAPRAPSYLVASDMGRDTSGARGRTVTLEEGKALENIDFTIERGGVLTGRIFYDDGSPAIDEEVSITSVNETKRGAEPDPIPRNLGAAPNDARDLSFAGRTVTDDRGNYRFFGLGPGRYLVSAGQLPGEMGPSNYHRLVKNLFYRATYYPATPISIDASLVQVAPGGETTDINIKLGQPIYIQPFQIAGRVVNSTSGPPPTKVSVSAERIWDAEPMEVYYGRILSSAKVNERGAFVLNGLPAGRYRIRPYAEQSEGVFFPSTVVTIKDADISGLVLTSKPGVTVSGRLVIDNTSGAALPFLLTDLAISVSTTAIGNKDMTYGRSAVNPDGSFSVGGLQPGPAEIELYSFDKGLKLRYLERDGKWIGNVGRSGSPNGRGVSRDFVIDGDRPVTELVLGASYDDHAVRGVVVGGHSRPWPDGVQILVSYKHIGSEEPWVELEVGQNGYFCTKSLPFGKYAFLVKVTLPGASPDTPPLRDYETVVLTSDSDPTVTMTAR